MDTKGIYINHCCFEDREIMSYRAIRGIKQFVGLTVLMSIFLGVISLPLVFAETRINNFQTILSGILVLVPIIIFDIWLFTNKITFNFKTKEFKMRSLFREKSIKYENIVSILERGRTKGERNTTKIHYKKGDKKDSKLKKLGINMDFYDSKQKYMINSVLSCLVQINKETKNTKINQKEVKTLTVTEGQIKCKYTNKKLTKEELKDPILRKYQICKECYEYIKKEGLDELLV
jgi:hypothetical protein